MRNLLEVRESTPLTLLMGNDRRMVGLFRLVVAWEKQLLIIVVIARRRMLVPIETTCTSLHMIFGTVVPSPAATNSCSSINLGGVVLVHLLHPVVTVADPVACGFIAGSHHHKRRMMSVLVNDAFGLVHQILVDFLSTAQLHTMIRPRRSFHLQVNTYLVGCCKGCLRRTIRMEADVIQAILLALSEDAQPLGFVGRRITRLWETAVFYRST